MQIQYADATLTKGIGAFLTAQAAISGTGWGYGFTAGLTPMPGTTIGLGYRSALDQKIDGSLVAPAFVPASTVGSVTTIPQPA